LYGLPPMRRRSSLENSCVIEKKFLGEIFGYEQEEEN
jgi:hypothetical protein